MSGVLRVFLHHDGTAHVSGWYYTSGSGTALVRYWQYPVNVLCFAGQGLVLDKTRNCDVGFAL